MPPLPSPPCQPSLDRDAGSFRADSRQDERGWLVGLPELGFYGTFPRVDPLSQNGCACRETCPVGAHESRAEIGFAGEEDQPQDSLIKINPRSRRRPRRSTRNCSRLRISTLKSCQCLVSREPGNWPVTGFPRIFIQAGFVVVYSSARG